MPPVWRIYNLWPHIGFRINRAAYVEIGYFDRIHSCQKGGGWEGLAETFKRLDGLLGIRIWDFAEQATDVGLRYTAPRCGLPSPFSQQGCYWGILNRNLGLFVVRKIHKRFRIPNFELFSMLIVCLGLDCHGRARNFIERATNRRTKESSA